MLKFGDKVVGYAKVELPLKESDIENIMVTAIEGGINYWAGLDNTAEAWAERPKDEPLSMWATKILIDGGSVKFYDVEGGGELEEEEDDSEWILTLDKLLAGFAQNYKERPHDNDLEQGDATTADCIIQYALFGQIVFG